MHIYFYNNKQIESVDSGLAGCFESIHITQDTSAENRLPFSGIPQQVWGIVAEYTNFCFNLRDITHPIEASVDRKSFKVYMSDTGMLNSLLGTESIRATYLWETGYNMGAITENAVAEGIRKSGLRVRYYGCTDNSDGRRMEIDFILEFGRDIIAIEVKSGRDRSAPSLGKVRKVFNQVNRRAVLSRTNVYTDKDGIEHYPLFAACFANELAKDWDGPSFIGFDE